jgi:putative salt-induced outer membrane protein
MVAWNLRSGSDAPKPEQENNMKKLTLSAILAMSTALPVHAEGWTGGLELGFSNTAGNSRDTSLNTRFDLKHENAIWSHEFYGDAYYAKSDGEKTAERIALGYKPRRELTDRSYAFGTLRYERDRFSDILARWTTIGGYGRTLYESSASELEAELGAGVRRTRYDLNPDRLRATEPILYVGGRFAHEISDSAKFVQTLRVEFGDDNTWTESISSLTLRVTDSISAKLSHTIRRNSAIEGVRGKKVDQITGVNMVYSF